MLSENWLLLRQALSQVIYSFHDAPWQPATIVLAVSESHNLTHVWECLGEPEAMADNITLAEQCMHPRRTVKLPVLLHLLIPQTHDCFKFKFGTGSAERLAQQQCDRLELLSLHETAHHPSLVVATRADAC